MENTVREMDMTWSKIWSQMMVKTITRELVSIMKVQRRALRIRTWGLCILLTSLVRVKLCMPLGTICLTQATILCVLLVIEDLLSPRSMQRISVRLAIKRLRSIRKIPKISMQSTRWDIQASTQVFINLIHHSPIYHLWHLTIRTNLPKLMATSNQAEFRITTVPQTSSLLSTLQKPKTTRKTY